MFLRILCILSKNFKIILCTVLYNLFKVKIVLQSVRFAVCARIKILVGRRENFRRTDGIINDYKLQLLIF